MNWNCISKGILDLSKEALWVSVGQRAVKLQAFKGGDLKKNLPLGRPELNHTRAV